MTRKKDRFSRSFSVCPANPWDSRTDGSVSFPCAAQTEDGPGGPPLPAPKRAQFPPEEDAEEAELLLARSSIMCCSATRIDTQMPSYSGM